MRLLICALLVLLLCACGRTSSSATEAMELRQYPVPAERTQAVVNTLNGVLMGTEHQAGVGRASSDVEGVVVVLAPARLHESIGRTIGDLVKPEADARGSVRVEYWLLDSVPGAAEDDASVAGLEAPLQAARAVLGDLRFQLAGHAAQVTALGSGQRARSMGQIAVVQETRPTPDGVHLGFNVERSGTSGTDPNFQISGEAQLPYGQTLVLAQQSLGATGSRAQRLLLVRAEPVGAQ